MLVENSSDELRVGVKGLSNLVIAGSPRNSFRASLVRSVMVVEHWMDLGPYPGANPNQTPNAINCSAGVRLRAIRSVVERETAQTAS